MVRSGAARGGSWGLLGSLLAPLGVVVGLPRCPRRLPEGPREGPGEPPGRHYGTIFAARPAGTEKVRKIRIFLDMFDVVFMLFLAVLLRLPRCAGASAHLEKYWFSPGGYCKNRLSAINARNGKTTELMIIVLKRQAENQSKKACRETCEKPPDNIEKSAKKPPKIAPGGLRRPLASQLGAWSLPKRPKTHQNHAKRAPGGTRERLFSEKGLQK